MDETRDDAAAAGAAVGRFRQIAGGAVALAALGYLGYAVWSGLQETAGALGQFNWPLYLPILALTLVNYGLRYAKWAYLLHGLGVRIPHRENLVIFVTGLAMVISPGKAGELIKPYLVRERTGVPIARTLPALVTERLTDGIAVVILAAFGVGTFYAEGAPMIWMTLGAVAVALGAIAYEPLGLLLLGIAGRLPGIGALAPKLTELWQALRTCLAPRALVVTMALSMVAWWAECVGYWLVFRGLAVDAGLDASTFLYAFATVFGAPSPGGLGMADVALVEGSVQLIAGLDEPTALAAALLVRIATLWFGVFLGAILLLRLDAWLPPRPAGADAEPPR
jgi:uncharacterized membrane protein YbhN (UPF0104 family)